MQQELSTVFDTLLADNAQAWVLGPRRGVGAAAARKGDASHGTQRS